MTKILIVEDDPSIATLLEYNLKKMNYIVQIAIDGKEGFELFKSNNFDIILMDLMLPKIDGITLTKKIRLIDNEISILMLTALSAKQDIIKGLNVGADDYVTKPFSPDEIVARIQALLRRKKPLEKKEKHFIFKNNLLINSNGMEVELTRKEFELFNYLYKNAGQVLSREQIITNVWPIEREVSSRAIDMQVRHLREKIEDDSKNPKYLLTVRGFGYKLEVPDED